MVSELRKNKLYHVFSVFFDTDQNGVWNRKDFEKFLEKLSQYKSFTEDMKKELHNNWIVIFENMLKYMELDAEEISFEVWVKMWEKYADDPNPSWCEHFEQCVYEYCCDRSENGITSDSIVPIYTFFGISNEDANISFKMFSQNKPVVDRVTYKRLWREYFTSDDPNVPGNYLHGCVKF